VPAAAFLLSSAPIEMLGQATQLVISGKAAEAPVGEFGGWFKLECTAVVIILMH
jgi:hypothetical protein